MNNLRQYCQKNSYRKNSYQNKTIALILALVFAGAIEFPAQGRSSIPEKFPNIFATRKTHRQNKSGNRFQAPPPPSGTQERPAKRRDAGSSGSCERQNSAATEFLTALVPKQNHQALTADSHPTFWFYIPFPSSNFHSLKFRLETESGYQVVVKPKNDKPGIVSFTIPPTEKPLEIGKDYKWALFLYCQDPETTSSKPVTFFVSSSIRRIAPINDMENQLKIATTASEKSAIYARYGIWHDALTLIGNSHRADLTNEELARDWVNLLSAVELEDIAKKPFADL
ncbi:MAG: DUF928 domain-containing protein [Oscillatoriaceae cyanobacterium Prado104]|jgi:hypothetical protein|nr:DUF928 domain-containing protein [Oscillatoriaceae cyanobacterium Prado104]